MGVGTVARKRKAEREDAHMRRPHGSTRLSEVCLSDALMRTVVYGRNVCQDAIRQASALNDARKASSTVYASLFKSSR
jgi:hypothetical protein